MFLAQIWNSFKVKSQLDRLYLVALLNHVRVILLALLRTHSHNIFQSSEVVLQLRRQEQRCWNNVVVVDSLEVLTHVEAMNKQLGYVDCLWLASLSAGY